MNKTLASLFLAMGFSLQALAASTAVIDRDGIAVTEEDLLADMVQRNVPEAVRRSVLSKPETIKILAKNIYVRRALTREAEKMGLDKDAEVARILVLVRERLLTDAYLLRQAQVNPPSAELIERTARADYNANLSRFRQPEKLRARHILIDRNRKDAADVARSLLEKLKGGADFAALALEYSDDPGSKTKGGDLGVFSKGRMVKPFEDAAFALAQPGDLSDVVQTNFGYHIIRLEERIPSVQQSFDEVKAQLMDEVAKRLMTERRKAIIDPIEAAIIFDDAAAEAIVARHKQ